MLDEQFRKLLENNITCYAHDYDFYYNLENMIAKPRNFTKIAGRITRIVANKELTMDETFYYALRVGMSPAGGVGFGIDRLLMILTNSSDIIDVVPFSTYHESQKSN